MATERAKHAFGTLEKVDSALAAGTIDAYDILFVKDANGKPYVGWIDKEGNKVIVEEEEKIIVVDGESLPESGESGKVYIFGEDGYFWNGEKFVNLCKPTDVTELVEDIAALEETVATKVSAEEVDAKIDEVDVKFGKYTSRIFEIVKVPDGTLVDYFDKEIRVLIPANADFTQNNGVNGAENMRYIECRMYAPENAVRYKFDFGGMVGEGAVEDFAGCTDEYGRIYIVGATPVAYYNAESATWVYYGVNSTTKHYIGWSVTANWYDENDVMISSDSIKINLSNEDCHYAIEPYYVGETKAEVEEMITKAVEDATGIEVIEF